MYNERVEFKFTEVTALCLEVRGVVRVKRAKVFHLLCSKVYLSLF